jgi:hypothetical protein
MQIFMPVFFHTGKRKSRIFFKNLAKTRETHEKREKGIFPGQANLSPQFNSHSRRESALTLVAACRDV